MPKAWSKKDERMYKHIVEQCVRSRRSIRVCKRIAGSTVNKLRKRQGRTLSGCNCGGA